MDSGRLQPALLGGVFIGVMSALPIVNAGNCCCCLWVLAGGALAVYLRKQNSAIPITAAEGALVGLLAGAIGGVIGSVLNIPIQMMMGPMQAEWMSRIASAGNEDMPPEFREMIDRMAAGGALGAAGILMSLVNIVMSTIFGMLGGLLGVAIFNRNAPPPVPPAPTMIPHDPGVAQ
jgi:hypothetical protein